jgi:predicted ABC-type ATPase
MTVGKTRKLAIVQRLKLHCPTRVDLPVWRTKHRVTVGTELIEGDKVTAKQSRYRPAVAQRVPGS